MRHLKAVCWRIEFIRYYAARAESVRALHETFHTGAAEL
jgi:hypothetical protein